DSLADLTGVTQKSVLFRNGTGLYDSDFNYDPSSNQLKIGSGYGFQESGSVIYFNSPGGFGGQASNSGRLNYNISSGSGNPTLGVYSSTHSGIGYTKVGPTVYGDIISMDTITARFTDTSFVVKKPLIIEDSLQWPDGTWQSTASSGGSSPWTIDADGIHYSNNIGVGINSSSFTSIKTNGQTYGIYSVGTTYGMYGEGANTGVYGSGGTGVKGLGVNYGVYSYSVDGIGLKSQTLNNLKIASFESGSPTTEKAYIDSSGSYISQGYVKADSIGFVDGTWQTTALKNYNDIDTATIILTNDQILNNDTITLLPAQGSGVFIEFVKVYFISKITSAYTGNPQIIVTPIAYGPALYSGSSTWWDTGDHVTVAHAFLINELSNNTEIASFNQTSSTGGGNAANTVKVVLFYKKIDISTF
ncbi:MAG TPA: hypothetical protein VJ954_01365, partial [Ignavibacteriaceae bacterium]|nr:hypothetical protein [Ignavibacteriaceae bacterium]